MMKKLQQRFGKSRLFKNVSWIFFGNIAYSALHFVLGIFVARELSLNDNGLLNYGGSLIAFLTSMASLGFGSTITRELAEHEDRDGDYLCSCILSQCGTNILAVMLIQVIVRIINPGEPLLYTIVFWQSIPSAIGSVGLFVYWFRYKNQPNVAAVWRLLAFFVTAVFRVIALAVFDNLVLYVAMGLAETILFCVLLTISFFKLRTTRSFRFSRAIVKDMLKGSYPFIFAAVLTTVYAQTDKMMLKFLLDNEAVALYGVAVHVAGLLSQIPATLIEGFRPDVMENKVKNEAVYLRRMRQLYAIIFWASIAYGVFVTLFAKQIILILYGEKYLGSVPALSLVVWYTAFSYFGSINNMYMVAEKKAKWVQVTTLTGALCNVVLNFVCIPVMGTVGAALASLLTQFAANFLMMFIIPDLRPGFKNMIRGICLRDIK